ncbi:hypothetical protein POX_d05797 [Penicillium oxalicum]|uniref:hypothetical protein n=1 Tax=Penicillium oxalicum TaxID=69781 RepID=UPI0020B764A0|nr:hypothetical protein POX_d05797 [Penicillium oxalicum]KAI2790288.1 hypothetical protein POX_d05797 [Penicillium oxalicum]
MTVTVPNNGPGEYLLVRDAAEKERLEMQFRLWQSHLGYLLHPTIEQHEHMRIADVGTGTGAWLRELAAVVPETCQLDGFDISDDLFYKSLTQRTNLSFHLQNVLQPFPEEFVGKYDVVNVRLLAVALSSNEWPTAVRNVVALLRPGGHLQWSDCAPQGCVVKAPPGVTPTRAIRMMEVFYKTLDSLGKTPEIHNLLGIFQKSELVSCKMETIELDKPEMRDELNLTITNVMAHGLTASFRLHKLEDIQSEQQIADLRDGVLEDLRTIGCYFSYSFYLVIGQKPL